jgi:phosphoglycerate dehydrogenase-like enzyme
VLHKVRVPGDVLRRGRRLRLIQHLGLDYRGVPVESARAMGVPVAATPLVNYQVVAEHTWALILNHLKQLPAQRDHMQTRGYMETWGTFPNLKPVCDMTLGLLGFGEIARPVARIGRAFGMPVMYWDIERFPELEKEYGVEYAAWDEVFSRADVLSIHLALNDKTEGIVGAREIGLMKPSALFVNTARGKLVDQAALVSALQSRKLGGAALDVFAEEPLALDDPLHVLHQQLDANVTLTPHSAWQSPWTWVRDSHGIWLNVLRMLRGQALDYLIE